MIYVLTFLLYAILEFYILVSGVGYYYIKKLKDFYFLRGFKKIENFILHGYSLNPGWAVNTLKHGNILFLLSGLFDDKNSIFISSGIVKSPQSYPYLSKSSFS